MFQCHRKKPVSENKKKQSNLLNLWLKEPCLNKQQGTCIHGKKIALFGDEPVINIKKND